MLKRILLGVLLVLPGLALAEQPPRAPTYQVDPFWPKPLPNNWGLGQVAAAAVDSRDHVWIIHRPRTMTPDERGAALTPPRSLCCIPAPAVIEFDPDGNVVQAWGGPGHHPSWPESEHGIYVDPRGNVWVGGNGANDHVLLKFTRDGRFLLQIGRHRETGGSNDTERLGRPADVDMDPATHELYVADGYGNRRVIVFDAETCGNSSCSRTPSARARSGTSTSSPMPRSPCC